MKRSALLLLSLLLPVSGTAQEEVDKGVSLLDAEIMQASGETVTLRNTAGKVVTLPLSQLAETDRVQVQDWKDRQAPALQVTPHFTSSDHGTGSTQSHQVLTLSVDLESPSAQAGLEGHLRYILIGRDMEDEHRYKVLAVQSVPFSLKAGEPAELAFKTVKNYYQSGKEASKGARCIGYVLQARHKEDGRPLFSLGSTPFLDKAVEAISSLKVGETTNQEFVPLSAAGPELTRKVTAN